MADIISIFANIEEFRTGNAKKHKLGDIVLIAIAAVISQCSSWYEIEEFGVDNEEWFRSFLELPNGIPSHDTFNRVISILPPETLENCLRQWADAVAPDRQGRVVATDGKTIRGVGEHGELSFTHIVTAWCCEYGLSLGQLKTDAKSNEITILPELLKAIDIKGAIVTADAMGCQKKAAASIIEGGADYILAVKGNQGSLYDGILDGVKILRPSSKHVEVDAGHGRVEERHCHVYTDLSTIFGVYNWPSIAAFIHLRSVRYIKATGKETVEDRYFITSCKRTSAAKISSAIRKHWSVENNLHWMLDVTFQEDKCRKKRFNAAQNFSRLNRLALCLLKRCNMKVGRSKSPTIHSKRLAACRDLSKLFQVLCAV